MKIQPSTIAGVALFGPGTDEFEEALRGVLERAPKSLLDPALPFSVVVSNDSSRAIALLGVRFDMIGARAAKSSVVHYADTLRHPESADFRPGTRRLVCAEPAYTALALRGEAAFETRGRMNLDNLHRMVRISATIDCVAFEDGRFEGPDSRHAFDRIAREGELESVFLAEVLAAGNESEALLVRTVEESREPVLRSAARKMLETGTFRRRIPLWRGSLTGH